MPNLLQNLIQERCPHCSVAKPRLDVQWAVKTADHSGRNDRHWAVYKCSHCGGLVTAWSSSAGGYVMEQFPALAEVHEDIPARPRAYLSQAQESLHAPAGSIMLAASAVDSMLKLKGFTEGNLYTRIGEAAAAHVITAEMAQWAHHVRLDANDQRHADERAELPTDDDARRALQFALGLAQFMFVLPAIVQRGIAGEN